MAAVQDNLVAGVVSTIQELALTGTYAGNVGQNVYDQLTIETTNVVYPCVVCWADTETAEDLTSQDDLIEYVVNVAILDRDSKRDHRMKLDYWNWRREIARKFRSLVTIEGVSECYDVRVRPKAILDKSGPAYEQVVSSLAIACKTAEARLGT